MPKISVAIATFNEEKNIGECLKSVADWTDEVVIVDGSSTDKTREIAKKYKAKIILADNPPVFHINKQKAIDVCSGDWILQLDADERVTPELEREIIKLVNQSPSGEIAAYYLPRRNYFLNRRMKKGGLYPDRVIRLFRKGKARLLCKNVHEQMEVNGKVGFLKNELIHLTAPIFSRYMENSNRYTELEMLRMEEENVRINFFSMLSYLFLKPIRRFLEIYVRHKGFIDGFPGFVFAFYSGLHIFTSYIKYWERKKK